MIPTKPRHFLFILLFIWMALTRFAALGERPFHHDESLFAYYAWTLFESGSYSHDPLLHGPLQIQALSCLFRVTQWLGTIGDGCAVARSFAAASTALLVFPLFGMRRWLGRAGLVAALGFAAVSPGLWYYGRFCRNESPFLLVTALLVLSVARAWRSRHASPWILLGFVSAALLVAMKENSLFLLFNAFWFAVLLAVSGWANAGRSGGAAHGEARRRRIAFIPLALASLRLRKYAWVSGVVLAWLLLEAVYTNGFVWDKSFPRFYLDIMRYWAGQHKEHRLYGEFHYYLPVLAVYEPLATLIVLGAAGAFLSPVRRFGVFAAMLGFLVLGVAIGEKGDAALRLFISGGAEAVPSGTLLKMLHMTSSLHLGGALALGWVTLCATWSCIRAGRWFRAWLVWWCGLSLLQYSYAGEKVPWLALHIVLPLLLLAAELAGAWWRRQGGGGIAMDRLAEERMPRSRRGGLVRWAAAAVFGAALLVNLAQGYRVCFLHPTYPGEILVYNHTQTAMRDVARLLRAKASQKSQPLLQGNAMWPLLWYMHGVPYHWVNESEKPDLSGVGVVVCDKEYAERWPEIGQRFEVMHYPLRQAWVPERLHLFGGSGGDEAARVDPSLTGRGAWKSLWNFLLWRRMWGNPDVTAVPMEVCVGWRKVPARAASDVSVSPATPGM